MNVNKCRCGNDPQYGVYLSDDEEWYFVKCTKCGRETRMHYNILEYAVQDWNNGDTIGGIDNGVVNNLINGGDAWYDRFKK